MVNIKDIWYKEQRITKALYLHYNSQSPEKEITSVMYSPDHVANMYRHVHFGGMSGTFYTGSLSCKINKGHIQNQLPHSLLKSQQGAGQLG